MSKDQFNTSSNDAIVCGISSNISKDHYTISVKKNKLEEGTLDTCCIKVENVLRVDKKLLIKKIGKVKKEIFSTTL